MADDTQATLESVETPTEATPTSEQQVTESAEVSSTAQETGVPEGAGSDAGELPESASERTRRGFDRVQAELKEERARRIQLENAFNAINYKPEPEAPPVYDSETGFIDPQALTSLQKQAIAADRRAKRAEERIEQFVVEQQSRETFAAYPELNPEGDKFNRAFHRQVRATITDSIMNPTDYGGKELTFKEAADLVKGVTTKDAEAAKKEGAKEALESLSPKEQAALEATGRSDRRVETQDSLEDLRLRTRGNDLDAVMARLKNIPNS